MLLKAGKLRNLMTSKSSIIDGTKLKYYQIMRIPFYDTDGWDKDEENQDDDSDEYSNEDTDEFSD